MKYSDALTWFERDILPQPYMMKKPLLVHLINGEIEIRWVGRLGVDESEVIKNKDELCYKTAPEYKVQIDSKGQYYIYTWVDEECWDNEKYILGDLTELEIAYDALKREFNLMRSTYG